MKSGSDKASKEEKLLAKGFRKPFYPAYGDGDGLRRWDGNEILGAFGDRVVRWLRPVLRIGPIEFIYTLLAGPVLYEEHKPTHLPLTQQEVEAQVTTEKIDRLEELYGRFKELIGREEETRASVEGRANVLLGAGGLTTTLIVGVSGLLARGDLNTLLPSGTGPRAVFLAFYLAGLLALTLSLLRAVQAAKVATYRTFSAALPLDVQEFAPSARLRKLIVEAFMIYLDLTLMIRIKVGFLKAAQFWFGTALALLLAMAAVPVLAPLIGWLVEVIGETLTCRSE